jgi:hypothetical protein
MIGMISMYILFLGGGLMILRKREQGRKECYIYIGLTTVGAVLWGSIILRCPLDLNKVIAYVCDQIQ